LKSLSKETLLKALTDEQAIVRKQAILLAERRIEDKDILEKLIQMAGDPDSFVQFQLALTLGNVANEQASSFYALSKIAADHIDNPWFQAGVLLGASENSLRWYDTFKK